MRIATATLTLLIAAGSAFPARAAGPQQDFFWGGDLGLSFGTIDYVDISPLLGMYVTDELSAGIQLTYRYRDDSRYSPSLSTSDYGGRLFARYDLFDMPLFAQAEYEYLRYEFVYSDLSTGRDSYDALLVGGGFTQPIGPSAAMYLTALYNVNYDSNDPYRPYDDPLIIRVGVSVGF